MLLKKNRLLNSVRFKLVLRYVSISTIGIGILFLSVRNRFKSFIEEKSTQHIVEILNSFDWLDTISSFDHLNEITNEFNYRAIPAGIENVFYILFDSHGKAVATSDFSYWETSGRLTIQEVWNNCSFPQNHDKIYLNRSWNHAYLKKFSLSKSQEIVQIGATYLENNHVFVFGRCASDDISFYRQLMRTIGIGSVLISILCFLVLYSLIHKVFKDIYEITHSVDRIEKGNQNKEVTLMSSGSELQDLAGSFNAMIDKINMYMYEMEGLSNDITHDLRSPVASIRSISETSLISEYNENEHKQAFEKIIEKSDHLISMINTILDIAQIESTRQYASFEKLDISEIIEDAYEFYLNVAEEKRISLVLILEEKELYVSGNRAHLQRAVSNIIDNAIKFTPADGKVSISAYKTNKKIIFEIIDDGIGIEPIYQQKIFAKFFQVDSSRKVGGNGLGLSFLLAVITKHGGKILVKSKINEGTTLIIHLDAIENF